MFYMELAELLHKTLDEILSMSTFEVRLWVAYFNKKNEAMSGQA